MERIKDALAIVLFYLVFVPILYVVFVIMEYQD